MPTVRFARDNATRVGEGDGAYAYALELSEASPLVVSVVVAVSDPQNGPDVAAGSQTIVFQPGQTRIEGRIAILDDSLYEPAEYAALRIDFAHNAQVDPAGQIQSFNIIDNEPATDLTVRFAGPDYRDVRVGEDAGFYERQILLSRPSTEVVTVTIGTSAGISANGYDGTAQTLTFQPGETVRTFRFAVRDDRIDEADEQFSFQIQSATHAAIAGYDSVPMPNGYNGVLSGYIVDNDLPTGPAVRFAAAPINPIVLDENVGTTRIVLELTAPATGVVTAVVSEFAYSSNGARSESHSVTFQPGQTSASFDLVIADNRTVDFNAGVSLVLGSISNATPDYSGGAASSLTLRVRDDENVSVSRGTDGADTLVAVLGTNDLFGLGGDDRLISRGYDNHLAGGNGTDTAIYLRPFKAYDLNYDDGDGYVHGRSLFGAVSGYVAQKHDVLQSIERIEFADGTLSFDAGSHAAQVQRLYSGVLGREGDYYGVQGWTHALDSGATLVDVAAGFVGSGEFRSHTAGLGNAGLVDYLYRSMLGREADAGGRAGWIDYLDTGHSLAELVVGFSESGEHIALTAQALADGYWTARQSYADVESMYLTVLGRVPDAAGLTGWARELESGLSIQDLGTTLLGSAEYRASVARLDNGGIVDALYANALHRPADAAGRAGFTAYLDHGGPLIDVVLAFETSDEFRGLALAHMARGVDFSGGDFPLV